MNSKFTVFNIVITLKVSKNRIYVNAWNYTNGAKVPGRGVEGGYFQDGTYYPGVSENVKRAIANDPEGWAAVESAVRAM